MEYRSVDTIPNLLGDSSQRLAVKVDILPSRWSEMVMLNWLTPHETELPVLSIYMTCTSYARGE